MNTKQAVLSLALLASTPCMWMYSSDCQKKEQNSEVAPKACASDVLEFVWHIVLNQNHIKKLLKDLMQHETDSDVCLKDLQVAITNVLDGLKVVLSNQEDILALIHQLKNPGTEYGTKEVIKLTEGQEVDGIRLVIANQHSIMNALRNVRGIESNDAAREAEELTVCCASEGVRTIIVNQFEIIALINSITNA